MLYFLDGTEMKTVAEAHGYLAKALGFPEYYGKNLDALYDCLTDMAKAEIFLTSSEQVDPKVMRVIKDASDCFRLIIL